MKDKKDREIKRGDRICCVGHITHDRVITPDFEENMPGGTAYYFAKALKGFDRERFELITSVGEDGMKAVEELREDGVRVKVIPSRNTVYFENKYGEDMNSRKQRVLAKADPFSIECLEGTEAEVYHLGTLLDDDFSSDFIKKLSERGIVSVDVQGLLREVRGEEVVAIDYADKLEALPYIDILKANEHEMETLTGSSDPKEAARILAEWGVKEVVLTFGDKGSLIYKDGLYHEIPAYPVEKAVDATGCGDTYMAAYLYQRSEGKEIEEAARFAAMKCSEKLGRRGG